MVAEPIYQSHQRLQTTLKRLEERVSISPADFPSLKMALKEVQQVFQQEVLVTDLDALDGAIASRIQSLHTEINKQIRLLNTDILFLQSARQATTIQQRQAQMGDRIQTMVQYCQIIVGGSA